MSLISKGKSFLRSEDDRHEALKKDQLRKNIATANSALETQADPLFQRLDSMGIPQNLEQLSHEHQREISPFVTPEFRELMAEGRVYKEAAFSFVFPDSKHILWGKLNSNDRIDNIEETFGQKLVDSPGMMDSIQNLAPSSVDIRSISYGIFLPGRPAYSESSHEYDPFGMTIYCELEAASQRFYVYSDKSLSSLPSFRFVRWDSLGLEGMYRQMIYSRGYVRFLDLKADTSADEIQQILAAVYLQVRKNREASGIDFPE